MKQKFKTFLPSCAVIALCAFWVTGCTASKVNWDSRIGNLTYDQAIVEMGPPDRSANLSDGRTVAEWLTFRGRTGGRHYPSSFYAPYYGSYSPTWYHSEPSFPDQFVRLTFSPEGRLENWKKVAK